MENATNLTSNNFTVITDPTQTILECSRFWIQRVFVPLMVCIGVAGNTITVMVLTRRRMRSSTNIYLSALAIADIIYLFFVLILSFHHYDIHDRRYELYWRFNGLSHWLCDAASNTSVWLTVSFTIERYIAVCHPMRRKLFCTENRAKTVIVIVYIFCTITIVSTAFENQLNINETCANKCPMKRELVRLNINNKTTMLGDQSHNAVIFTDNNSNKYPVIQFVDDIQLQERVKKLLSNCSNTTHPHVIYVFPRIMPVNSTQHNIVARDDQRSSDTVNNSYRRIVIKHQEGNYSSPSLDVSDTNDTETLNVEAAKCQCQTTVDVEPTNLGKNNSYTRFIRWYSSLMFSLIPLALIATFNSLLIRAVYLSQKRRLVMTNSQEDSTNNNNNISNENRITIMLISVVVMFVICQTPTAAILIYEIFEKDVDKTPQTQNIRLILGNIFNFLLTLNASCNFLLYSTMSKKFRTTFKKLFFERNKTRQDTLVLSSTKSRSSQKFNPYQHGVMNKRQASEYRTPRNLETASLTGLPRSKSLIARPIGRAKSSDVVF